MLFFGVLSTNCYLINIITSPILISLSISNTLSLLNLFILLSILFASLLSTSLSAYIDY